MIISGRINLYEIDKSKIMEGKNGKFLPIIIMSKREPDRFGNDFTIAISQSKEQRESGEKTVYIGQGKSLNRDNVGVPPPPKHNQDDLPF